MQQIAMDRQLFVDFVLKKKVVTSIPKGQFNRVQININ